MLYKGLLEPTLGIIGPKPLRDLSAGDVRSALGQLTSRYSTRSLPITRNAWSGLFGTPRPTIL